MGTDVVAGTTGDAVHMVLVLGDLDRAEMRPLVVWLKDCVADAQRWVAVSEMARIGGEFAANEFPDLIVVLQSWPNEFSTSDVNQLLAFAPLSRVVVCYGAWCESDGRNYDLWPRSVRIPVWAARPRIEREWRLIQAPGEVPLLPWSASREEIFAADHPSITASLVPQRILIDSPDSAYRRFLVEQFAEAGHIVVSDNPSVLMFDADPWGSSRAAALQALTDRYPQAISFALASLIQPPLVEELQGLGIESVLPKLGNPAIEFMH
jgi:hypothetical protein